MNTLFECLMIGTFCIAIGVILMQHISKKNYADLNERFMLFTIGIGFVIGAISRYFSANEWMVIFYYLGAYLTYVTLLFSWPPKGLLHNKGVGQHE